MPATLAGKDNSLDQARGTSLNPEGGEHGANFGEWKPVPVRMVAVDGDIRGSWTKSDHPGGFDAQIFARCQAESGRSGGGVAVGRRAERDRGFRLT